VAAALRGSLDGAVLEQFRDDGPRRFRLVFATDGRVLSVACSLESNRAWIGRPMLRRAGRPRAASSFAALCRLALVGRRLTALRKPDAERQLSLSFSGGFTLTLELRDQGAHAILFGAEQHQLGATRRGAVLHPAGHRPGRLDVFAAEARAIDDVLASGLRSGLKPDDALRRGLAGVGRDTVALVLGESAHSGRRVGDILCERLADLQRGALDPMIEAEADPPLRPTSRLWPWPPSFPTAAGLLRYAREDPAGTVGLFHEALDTVAEEGERRRALLALLAEETARVRRAELRVAEDRARFADPEQFRLAGEAILAGLGQARREGGKVLVPDPYREDGRLRVIDADPGQSLPRVAGACFARYRRAQRGLGQTEERGHALAVRRRALEALNRDSEVEALARDMRELGIPVGLERRSAKAVPAPLRLEGVRMLEASDGTALLVGKSARDNDRLTFKVAAPEDFWLHAAGVPGAHVVLRNPDRLARPAPAVLLEAAGIAAWYSDARGDAAVDVHWTRRKYVRRIRGASPGSVTLKRHETVRVQARAPRGTEC
jgi:predicted ribosome quality control (RQC) complex YloA/Tae2 family protein